MKRTFSSCAYIHIPPPLTHIHDKSSVENRWKLHERKYLESFISPPDKKFTNRYAVKARITFPRNTFLTRNIYYRFIRLQESRIYLSKRFFFKISVFWSDFIRAMEEVFEDGNREIDRILIDIFKGNKRRKYYNWTSGNKIM